MLRGTFGDLVLCKTNRILTESALLTLLMVFKHSFIITGGTIMKFAFLAATATTVFLSALTLSAGATVLFEDDFSSGDLSKWNYAVYGEVVTSPLDSSNNVLSFSARNSYGDTFSSLISGTGADNYSISFDYYTIDTNPWRNGGGFVGIDADGMKGGERGGPNGAHIWYLGTGGYSNVVSLPGANDGWQHVAYDFTLPDRWEEFSLMFEDFRGPGGDTFFDNIVVSDSNTTGAGSSPIPEPATILLFGIGLSGLAGSGLRRWM